VPSWTECSELVFPHHLSLEQCSSAFTARYKAALAGALPGFPVRSIADLTGGFGVDCWFISQSVAKVDYVERQPGLCCAVRHNFTVLGNTNVSVHQADSVDYVAEMDPVDLIYLDPSRRSVDGGKVVVLSGCEPDITRIKQRLLEKARFVLVKVSPMLDIVQALKQLPETLAVHVVSVDGECKELLFLLGAGGNPSYVEMVCINLKQQGLDEKDTFDAVEAREAQAQFAGTLGTYLYEPNASWLKAGAFAYITTRYPVAKLHPNSHLYTSQERVSGFPGRVFRVLDAVPYQPKTVKQRWPEMIKANITVRNFPDTVASIRRKLKMADGGDDYLFATTLLNGDKVLIRTVKAD